MRRLTLIALLALAAPALGQNRPGSIYQPDNGPMSQIADKIALRPGDILTVVINEQQSVKNEEATDLSRSTNLNYKLNVWDINPNTFSTLPRIDADSTDGFVGSGSYQKAGAFTARLAAVVVDALPNGNLVITGRREIRIDNETKLIEFTGMVRIYDISSTNSVASELVANAQVTYKGSGPMTDTTNRYGIGGWLHRWIAWIWPF